MRKLHWFPIWWEFMDCGVLVDLSVIVALKSMYPPCKFCLPHPTCSNQDVIWDTGSSLGQQHEAAPATLPMMAGWQEQLLAGGQIRPSTSAAPF